MTAIITFALLLLVAIYNVEGVCEDKNAGCSSYAEGLCKNYPAWAKFNCAKFCGLCPKVTHCPVGWQESSSDNTCFKVFNTKLSWYDANKACKTGGGKLVLIKSNKKNTVTYDSLSGSEYYWIGIKNTDHNAGVAMKYVDGTSLTYNNWKSDQPDNYQGLEHCVVMLAVNGKWSDISCTTKHPYICQKRQLN